MSFNAEPIHSTCILSPNINDTNSRLKRILEFNFNLDDIFSKRLELKAKFKRDFIPSRMRFKANRLILNLNLNLKQKKLTAKWNSHFNQGQLQIHRDSNVMIFLKIQIREKKLLRKFMLKSVVVNDLLVMTGFSVQIKSNARQKWRNSFLRREFGNTYENTRKLF